MKLAGDITALAANVRKNLAARQATVDHAALHAAAPAPAKVGATIPHVYAPSSTAPAAPCQVCDQPKDNPIHVALVGGNGASGSRTVETAEKVATGKSASHYRAQHLAMAEHIKKTEGGTIEQARAAAWSRNPRLMRAFNAASSGAASG